MATEQVEQQRREYSEGAAAKAQEVASQAKEQVQEKAEEVQSKASDQVRTQLNQRSNQLGEQVASFGRALHRAGEHLQGEGNDIGAKAVHQAGDRVQRLSRYLADSDADRFLGDLEGFSRRRPWAAGAIGLVSGFVGSRFLKASSEARYRGSLRVRRDTEMQINRDGGQAAALPQPEAPGYGTR